jgi:hypothetical protein
MRWALVPLALLLAVAGLLYSGGVAFMSTLSDATASLGGDGSGTVAATTGQVEPSAWPAAATGASAPSRTNPVAVEPSPASQPGVPSDPEDPSPIATNQSVFRSRKALETLDARELVRQGKVPK